MSRFQNQSRSAEKSAKSIDEAINAALAELGVTRDKVDIEVISEGSKGFLGFGSKDAVVKVTTKPAPVKPEVKSEPKAPETQAVSEAANASDAPAEEAPAEYSKSQTGNSRRRPRKNQRPKVQRPQRPVSETAPEGAVKPYVPTEFAVPSKEDDPVTAAKTFLTSTFAAMQIDVKAEVTLEDDMMTVNLEGDNMGIIIGKRGDTLDGLQYLTSLVVNRRTEDYIKVTIDTENYREKRAEALVALSNRLADKVTRTGKKFTLEPMNPYERRIIHSNLQDNENVSTFSVGSEPYRKVVIAPKHSKSRYDRRGTGYRKSAPKRETAAKAEKTGSYTTTYKADFKPTPHKAEYHNYEEYLAAMNGEIVPPINKED